MDGEGNGMKSDKTNTITTNHDELITEAVKEQSANSIMANQMGKRMSDLRDSRGWTQKSVADKLGKKVSTYAGWENGRRLPPTEMVPEIARALECTIDYLYGRTSDPGQKLADEIMKLNEGEIKILRGLKFSQEQLENLTDEQIREIRSFIEYQIMKITKNPMNGPKRGI